MRKLWDDKVSRRKLLGGAAATSAALPVLHELIPHQGLHGGTSAAAGRRRAPPRGAHGGSGHLGAVGRVDHERNGFDPHAILRDFDEGVVRGGVREWEIVAEDREIEVAPGVKYAAWTYNGRVPGPTLRAREGERLRIRFVNGSKHPHTMHFHGIHRDLSDGIPGIGAGQHRVRASRPSTSSTPRRSGSTSTTATPRRWRSTSPRASTARSSSTRRPGARRRTSS